VGGLLPGLHRIWSD